MDTKINSTSTTSPTGIPGGGFSLPSGITKEVDFCAEVWYYGNTMEHPTMTRLTHPTYKTRKAKVEAARMAFNADHYKPRVVKILKISKFGFCPTTSETTPLQLRIRSDNAMRSRKVKPSMPRMPWEVE